MDQSITIKIAGKEYPLIAKDAEMEQIMRIAAETINAKLAAYEAKYPDKSLADKLAFVTLGETVGKLSLQKKLSGVNDQIKALEDLTGKYLETIEKNSR